MDTNWQPSEADMARGIVFETEQEASLWDAALAFTKILETSATDDVCLCGWKEVMIGDNPKRILGNTHPLCPCHSREGVLIAFVESLKTLPQWKVIFNPSDPDPNGVTLEVQSTAQGSTAKLPGLHPMDMPELLDRTPEERGYVDPEPTRTALDWLDQYDHIKSIKDSDGFVGINVASTLITKEDFNSRLSASTVEYWPIDPGSYDMNGRLIPKMHGDGPTI